jgi:hypothetical protein
MNEADHQEAEQLVQLLQPSMPAVITSQQLWP